MALKDIVAGILSPLSAMYNKRQERKMAKESANAKLAMAKQTGAQNLEMTDAEWEALSIQANQGTWKDEYVTVSIVSVFNLIVLGGILAAFGDKRLLEGMAVAMQALIAAGVDVGLLMMATVFAALGLKLWRA